MEREFFGRYDLLGNPVYDDVHGRISIPSTKYVVHQINHRDNSVDLVFHGIDSISELICRLTLLRNEMVEKATGSTIKPKGE